MDKLKIENRDVNGGCEDMQVLHMSWAFLGSCSASLAIMQKGGPKTILGYVRLGGLLTLMIADRRNVQGLPHFFRSLVTFRAGQEITNYAFITALNKSQSLNFK